MSDTPQQSVCAIVGAGEGLGTSLARAFARHGCDIALLSRTPEGSAAALAAARAARPQGRAEFFAADARQPQVLEQALGKVATTLGPIGILVYNARGSYRYGPPLDTSYELLRDSFDLEVVGALAAAKAVTPAMIAAGRGTVIFSSATAAMRGSGRNAVFSIVKFGVRALSQSLAKAYASKGVHFAHVRLDCALDTPAVRRMMGDKFRPEHAANTDEVAQTYVDIHRQPKSAWSNEVELRPYTEEWTY